jgi:hypothetical protein
MSVIALEKRVTELETVVGKLLADKQRKRAKDWRKVVGMFEGDKLMEQIDAAGRRIRAATRRTK